jgi:cyclic pyranopterin monophosphate synthase
MKKQLSHFDSKTSRAKMVNVGHKTETVRKATTRCIMHISQELTDILNQGTLEKGDAFTVAKTAGILAAKQTGQLIPMCHPLSVNVVDIEIALIAPENKIQIQTVVETTAKTGVEMEAIVAASIAASTIYDMCKAVDKKIIISKLGLLEKTGGKSGRFYNDEMEWDRL